MVPQVATWWRSSMRAKPSWEARSTLRSMIQIRSALKAGAVEVWDNPLTLKVSTTALSLSPSLLQSLPPSSLSFLPASYLTPIPVPLPSPLLPPTFCRSLPVPLIPSTIHPSIRPSLPLMHYTGITSTNETVLGSTLYNQDMLSSA